jgi:hypothetical protein
MIEAHVKRRQSQEIPLDRLTFDNLRISSTDVRNTQTQDGSILLDVHHGQMSCLNLVGSKILELLLADGTKRASPRRSAIATA